MHILIRVLLIIFVSVFVTLFFFDYDFSEVELNLSSKVSCLDLSHSSPLYLCNTCFKVSSKNKTNENIIVESQSPFMLVSLKESISGMLSCEEWLQAVDYEEQQGEDPYYRQSIRLEPTVNKFLGQLQEIHKQIILVQRPQVSNLHYPLNIKQYSSLQRPYQVLSYFSRSKNAKPFRVYLTNDLIKSQSIHMLTLLMLAGNFAVFYNFHRGDNRSPSKKYKQNFLNVLGLFGTFVWWLILGLYQSYDLYITFCKVVFFSLSMGIIFGAAKRIFLGIFIIMYTFMTLQEVSALYRSFMQISMLFILVVRQCTDMKKQQYNFEKNSNKKLFFLIMTLLVVGCSISCFVQDDSTLGQIFKFEQIFLMIMSFLMGIKNLDGDSYKKLIREQKDILGESSDNFEGQSTSAQMYREDQSLDQSQLRQINK